MRNAKFSPEILSLQPHHLIYPASAWFYNVYSTCIPICDALLLCILWAVVSRGADPGPEDCRVIFSHIRVVSSCWLIGMIKKDKGAHIFNTGLGDWGCNYTYLPGSRSHCNQWKLHLSRHHWTVSRILIRGKEAWISETCLKQKWPEYKLQRNTVSACCSTENTVKPLKV